MTDSASKKIRLDEIARELREGKRTKHFLGKYGLTLPVFEELLKRVIREGYFSRDEFSAWKARKPMPQSSGGKRNDSASAPVLTLRSKPDDVDTHVISESDEDSATVMKLFSVKREKLKGLRFKVSLGGRKYGFTVEDVVHRSPVDMLQAVPVARGKVPMKKRQEEAVEYIAKHGWAAYLENRAFLANFEDDASAATSRKAKLVVVFCTSESFVAALHTPTPAINFYVAGSLADIKNRLSKIINTAPLAELDDALY